MNEEKDLIIARIEGCEEGSEVLNEVNFILNRTQYEREILDLLDQKGMRQNLSDELLPRIQKVCQRHGSKQTEKLLERLKRGEIMSSEFLTKEAAHNLGLDLSPVEIEFMKLIIGWAGKSGGKTEDGAGERALTLLSKGAERPSDNNKGDIKCGDKALEIKGMSSRLQYASSTPVNVVKSEIIQWLKGNGVNGIEDGDFANNGKYSYNLNPKGFERIQKDCAKHGWDLGGFFDVVIGKSFKSLTKKQISDGKRKFLNANETEADFEKFKVVWAKFEFMEYLPHTGCCGIGFINVESQNYHYFKNADSFAKAVEDKKFKVGCSINWNSGRSSTLQYTLH